MTVVRRPTPLALAAAVSAVFATSFAHAQEASPAATTPPPYRDRIIAPESLAPLPPDEDEDLADAQGLPRNYHADISLSHSELGNEQFDEGGVSFGAFWETTTLGSYSLDAAVFHSNRDRFDGDASVRGTLTLWQRNLFLDGGWRADNGLGVLNTPSLPLQRSQYRFYLPSVPLAGVSSEWVHDGRLRLQGAYGRAGNYTGTRLVGFDPSDGEVGSLGAQWNWSRAWSSSVSFLGTQGHVVPDALGEATLQPGNTRAMHAATAWQGARDTVQFNLLSSDTWGRTEDNGSALGAWIDAIARRGRYTHNYGIFRLEPDLAWGALPINNDVEGGYYRAAYQYARWNWNAGIDALHSLSGNTFDGRYASGYARYQATTTRGFGGSIGLRDGSGGFAHTLQLFSDKRSRWGDTRLQYDQAREAEVHSWQLSLDQALPLREGARLSTTAAFGVVDHEGEAAVETWSLALYGAGDLGNAVTVDGSARWTHADGLAARRGLDANLGINWRINPRWVLAANLLHSQGSQRSPFVLDPLTNATPWISTPRDNSVFLTLRYDHHAGRAAAVLGGAPGGAVGGIQGSIFLDENDDGVRNASELPAINVTVLLDGRYSVRTDSRGVFEFARVAVGAHTLTVVPDNLPLPWAVDEAVGQRSIEVHVREATRVDIPARRPR